MADKYIDQIIKGEDEVIVVVKDREDDDWIGVGSADIEHHSNGVRDATELAFERARDKD